MTARGSSLADLSRVSHHRGIGLVTRSAGLVSVSLAPQPLQEALAEALEPRLVAELAGVPVLSADWCPKDQVRFYSGGDLVAVLTTNAGG